MAKVKGTIQLIIGIFLFILPVFTWLTSFEPNLHIVEIWSTFLFFWFFAAIFIIVGLDNVKSRGLWPSSGGGDSGSSGTQYERHYHYDSKGNETGYTDVPKK